MNLLSDVITYVRRIIKSPSDAVISDDLIIDYINRFWLMDMDARMQLFDLKTKYSFLTTPGFDKYNMPMYDLQLEQGNQTIYSFPVYQGFMAPAYVNGIQVPFQTQTKLFYDTWPLYSQSSRVVALGNGGATYTLQLPFIPSVVPPVNAMPSGLLRGHVDMTGIIKTGVNVDPPITNTFLTTIPTTSVFSAVTFVATDSTGANAVVQDSGQFLTGNINYGLMMRPGNAPLGNIGLSGGYSTTSNTINYQTGTAIVTFTDSAGNPLNIPAGQNINAEAFYEAPGLPRAILFYNNVLTLRSIPDIQYTVELEAYLTPAAFLTSTNALPFGYMAEYLARGAARKILSDTGDTEQFMFYEPLFREQENLVWKRSQRQWTATRTETIYSNSGNQGYNGNFNSQGML